MKAIIARAKVRDGKAEAFEADARELARAVRANEPGNRLYRLCKTAEGEYVFLEIYEDDAALAAHMRTPHMKEIGARVFASMAGRPEITLLDVIDE